MTLQAIFARRLERAWKKPASFALTLIGAAASVMTSPVAAAIGIGARLIGYESASKVDTEAYSYLFNAQSRFGGY
jgi:hypothetical protein